MKINTNKLGFVLASSHRVVLIKSLDKMRTSTSLWRMARHKYPQIARSECSRCLRSMVTAGIAECINAEERVGRVYRLTSLGEHLREVIIQHVGEVA